jgi:hypothetical protein
VVSDDKADFEPTSATSVAVYDLTEFASDEDGDGITEPSGLDEADDDGRADPDENYWER